MADELVKGGGVAFVNPRDQAQYDNTPVDKMPDAYRTPSVNPGWFQALADSEGVSTADVKNAVAKLRQGKRLGVRQQRVVQFMLDTISGERDSGVDYARQELERSRQLRKGVIDDTVQAPGEQFEEAEYAPDWDGNARTLLELHTEADQIDPDAAERILESGRPDAEVARELIEVINRGRPEEQNSGEYGRGTEQPQGAAQGAREQAPGPPAEATASGNPAQEPNPPLNSVQEPRDLFGEVPENAQRLADERRRRDVQRSPGTDVPADTGGGLFSNETRQRDIEDVSEPDFIGNAESGDTLNNGRTRVLGNFNKKKDAQSLAGESDTRVVHGYSHGKHARGWVVTDTGRPVFNGWSKQGGNAHVATTAGGRYKATLAGNNLTVIDAQTGAGVRGDLHGMDRSQRASELAQSLRQRDIESAARDSGVDEPLFSQRPGDEAHEVERGIAAAKRVLADGGEEQNALNSLEHGPVSLVYGKPGDAAKDYKGGYGLSHIVAKHGREALDKVIATVANGRTYDEQNATLGDRVLLTYEGHTAVLSLYRYGDKQTWLLSGWDEKNPGGKVEEYDSTKPTPDDPTRFRDTGAGSKDTLSQPRASVEEARHALRKGFGKSDFDKLERSGAIRIVQHQDEVPGAPAGRRIGGQFDGETMWIVADNVDPDNVLGTFLHEGTHGSLRKMMGDEAYAELVDQAKALTGPEIEADRRRVERANPPAHQRDEELLAYLVEETVNRGHAKASGGAWETVRKIVARIRAWFYNTRLYKALKAHGVTMTLSPHDVVALTKASVRQQARDVSNTRAATPTDHEYEQAIDEIARFSIKGDREPTQAEIDEAQRQYAQVESDNAEVLRAHREDRKPLPAPDGKSSNLNEHQWIQVRTPNFRRYFGDWELSTSSPRHARTFKQAREAASAFKGKPITNNRTGLSAVVSRDNLDKMLSEKAVSKSENAQEHAAAVANLDALFSNAMPGWSKTDRDHNPNIHAVHRYFAPLRVDDAVRLAKITVKETTQPHDNNPLYTVESVSVEKGSPVPELVAADRAEGSRLLTGPTGLVDSLVQRIQDFKPDDVSKAIDANGEPLVVFHGVSGMIDADALHTFEHGHQGYDDVPTNAFMFTPDRGVAAEYTRGDPGNTVSSYLNIKNPLDLTNAKTQARINAHLEDIETPEGIFQIPFDAHESQWDAITQITDEPNDLLNEIIEYAKENDYDGIKLTDGTRGDIHDSWGAIHPNQIKSATGNVGTFSPDNPDIRYSVADDAPTDAEPKAPPKGYPSVKTMARRLIHPLTEEEWNIAAERSRRALSIVKMADNSPLAFKRQMRAYRAEVGRKGRDVEKIIDVTKDLTVEQRELLSDIVEKEVRPGDVPPEAIERIAQTMQASLDAQSREAVDLGMLSEDARQRWAGRYLPRFYAREKTAKNQFDRYLRAYFQKIDGSHLKGRGLFETVPKSEVSQWQALGWELREPLDPQTAFEDLEPEDKVIVLQ